MNAFALFFEFLQIGALSFGGGYGTLAMIGEIAVEKRGWLTADALAELAAIAEVTPGPIALNAASYTGYRVAGFAGAAVATLGCVLPSLVLVAVLASLYAKYRESIVFSSLLACVRPAVCALIFTAFADVLLSACFGVGSVFDLVGSTPNFVAILLFVGSLALCRTKKLPPAAVILIAGVCGAAMG